MKMIKQPTIPPMPKRPTFDARDTQYNLPIGTDCISRQAAIDALKRAKRNIHHNIERAIGDAICEILDEVENGIKQLPPIQPVSCSEFPNNSDTISRQQAIDDIWTVSPLARLDREWVDRWLRQLPPIQPKRGHWIEADVCGNTTSWECSCCHNWTGLPTGWNVKAKLWFCPKCTADMRGVTA